MKLATSVANLKMAKGKPEKQSEMIGRQMIRKVMTEAKANVASKRKHEKTKN